MDGAECLETGCLYDTLSACNECQQILGNWFSWVVVEYWTLSDSCYGSGFEQPITQRYVRHSEGLRTISK